MKLKGLVIGLLALAAIGTGGSGAWAATECPAQQNNVPGPYFIYFQTGSTKIDAKGMAAIQEAATKAKALYITRVCVRGKADKTGNSANNMALSQKRADAVAAQLAKAGVEQKYITTVAKGEAFNNAMNMLSGDNQDDRSVKIILAK